MGPGLEHDAREWLLERARDARFVLFGEASHGTHEFYRERAELTKRLIETGEIGAVAVEADWPDAYRVNRYVRGCDEDASAEEALSGFERFPAWMWRNAVVAEFVGWLRAFNERRASAERVGFYGLDLYGLYRSVDEVVAFLERVDPEAAARARARYSCFGHFGTDPQVYAYETGLGGAESCERDAIAVLMELRETAAAAAVSGALDEDRRFCAEMNALLVVDAEAHYRAVYRGGHDAWNLRDRHMVGTLDALAAHLGRESRAPARVVVWAHNSHVGDARATEMGEAGQVSVGGLVREQFGAGAAFVVGFTTYSGTVTAASGWGREAERMRVRDALPDSWEQLLHEHGRAPAFVLDTSELEGRGLQRAIGVVYRPQTEHLSHYFHASVADQFDALIHIDETRAVQPLQRSSRWDAEELPETYPSGL